MPDFCVTFILWNAEAEEFVGEVTHKVRAPLPELAVGIALYQARRGACTTTHNRPIEDFRVVKVERATGGLARWQPKTKIDAQSS
jgi:hypothetical protein